LSLPSALTPAKPRLKMEPDGDRMVLFSVTMNPEQSLGDGFSRFEIGPSDQTRL
jgi:hypothetical protein